MAVKYHYPTEYDMGNTPYISASNENNGVAQKIDLVADFQGNCIVTGKVGCTAFYQPDDFCATSDVNIFYPKFNLNEKIALFIVTIINFNENYKWGYGRQCRVGDSKEIVIKLPAKDDDTPDWDFMEQYIKSLNHAPLATANRGGGTYYLLLALILGMNFKWGSCSKLKKENVLLRMIKSKETRHTLAQSIRITA